MLLLLAGAAQVKQAAGRLYNRIRRVFPDLNDDEIIVLMAYMQFYGWKL